MSNSDHAPAAIDFVLKQEGGFVDNPADPGGATNRGVSLRAVRNLDADGHAGLDFDLGDVDADDIKLVDEPRARAFYRARFRSRGKRSLPRRATAICRARGS